MKKSNKISIIVPVYKTEIDIVKVCIQSILNQEYDNFEILMIDDGNTKEYIDMLTKICDDDKRIRIINKENGGASSARNKGLKEAKGDYVAFVDSDDKIENNFLSNAIHYINLYHLDIVMGGYAVAGVLHVPACNKIKLYYGEKINYLKEFFLSGFCTSNTKELESCLGFVAPWAKVFRTTAIADIMFDNELILSEDNLFNLYCLEKVQRIGIIPECWYSYSITANSICHKYRENVAEEIQQSNNKFILYWKRNSSEHNKLNDAIGYRMLRQLDSLMKYGYGHKDHVGNHRRKAVKNFIAENGFFLRNISRKRYFYISKRFIFLKIFVKCKCSLAIVSFYLLKNCWYLLRKFRFNKLH